MGCDNIGIISIMADQAAERVPPFTTVAHRFAGTSNGRRPTRTSRWTGNFRAREFDSALRAIHFDDWAHLVIFSHFWICILTTSCFIYVAPHFPKSIAQYCFGKMLLKESIALKYI